MLCRRFIYAVAINGVTGKDLVICSGDDLTNTLANLTAHADIPVLTGFVCQSEDDIKRLNAVSDEVIVIKTSVITTKEARSR